MNASPSEETIWEVIERCAVEDPCRLALTDQTNNHVSYGALSGMLASLKLVFERAGVSTTDVVAVILEDGIAGLAAVLGTVRFCTCSPLNPASSEKELRADLKDLGAVAVIASATAEIPKRVARDSGLLWIEASVDPGACTWRSIGSSPVKEHTELNQHLPGEMALLLHTSSTTGRRKIVPISTANLYCMIENTRRVLKLSREDRLLTMSKIFHTQGVLSPFAQIRAGGSVVLMQGFTPKAFRTSLDELQPSWFTCGPTMLRAVLNHLRQEPLSNPTSLRFIRSGGAPLPPALRLELQGLLRVPVLDVYGLTEVGAVSCTTPELYNSGLLPLDSASVGRSMGPAISIISSAGAILPAGEEGEIVISGPTVISGYLKDKDANLRAFEDGRFRTGDLGRLDSSGLLYVTGRLKEIINRGGQKIIPDEIDAVLAMHPQIHATAAFAVPHSTLGEDICCAVVLRGGAKVSELDLRNFARQQLAPYKVPRHIYFLNELPCGATGKPQRLKLTKMLSGINTKLVSAHPSFNNSSLRSSASSDPRYASGPGELQRELAAIWFRYVQADKAEPDQDFFTAGGDSLSAIAMLLEVEEVLGLKIHIAPDRFFDEPTLSTLNGLALGITADQSEATPFGAMELVFISGKTENFPIFMFPADGDEGSYFRRLGRRLKQQWSLALIRPQNRQHKRSLYAIEDAAAQAVALIRASRTKGPYALAGYCYGGVVAFEAACQLERLGEHVLLILFDTPMPGSPHLIWELGTYMSHALSKKRSNPNQSGRWEGFLSLRLLTFRLGWFVLRRIRPRDVHLQALGPLRLLCDKVRRAYFPLYRPASTDISVYHYVARDDGNLLHARGRSGWQKFCTSGVKTICLPGDHHTLLSEENLPEVANSMAAWILQQVAGT